MKNTATRATLIAGALWALACGSAQSDADGQQDGNTSTGETTMSEPRRLQPMSVEDEGPNQSEIALPAPVQGCSLDAPLDGRAPTDADAQTLHGLGQERIMAKDGPAAVSILSLASKKAPGDASIVGDLSTALLQCHLFEQAIDQAVRATELAPKDVDIAANLAQAYQIAGKLELAVDAYRRAIAIDPEDAAVHNNLAVLLVLRTPKEAEEQARKAVRLSPKNATYLVNLGYILYYQKRLVDAELILRRAIEADGASADAYNQLGLVLAAQKREYPAIEAFRKALDLNPHHRAARENLGALDNKFDITGPWNSKKNEKKD